MAAPLTSPRATPRWRRLGRGLLVVAGTLLVLLLALEALARLFVTRNMRSFLPAYVVDDVGGYRLQRGLSVFLYGANVSTNSLGWRGGEWSQARSPGTFRIALLGDSLAFGFGVEFADTCGEVLARLLSQRSGRQCEVLNFAMPGYNSGQELRVLRQHALTFSPDVVLVIATGNDHDPEQWVDAEGYQHWGQPGAADSRIDTIEFAPTAARWGLLRHSALLTWAKLMWTRYQMRRLAPAQSDWMQEVTPGPVPDDLRHGVLEPLLAMHDACRQRAIPMVLAVFAGNRSYRLCSQAFARATGDPVLEIPGLFPQIKSWQQMVERYSLGWDSHPNAAAHAIWASGLADLLFARGLLSPR